MGAAADPDGRGNERQRSEAAPSLRQALYARLRRQFGRPTGVAGALAGRVMAHRSSNRRRNAWVVSLLDVRRGDRVLEVGFGPGVAIQQLSQLAPEGLLCGIEHSAVMLHQARRRNAKAVRRGRVDLMLGSAEALPSFGEPFDKILAVNVIGFWDEPVKRLTALRRLLRAGGQIAIAVQPRSPGATDETSARIGAEITAQLAAAGFSQVRLETLALTPPVVCAIAAEPLN